MPRPKKPKKETFEGNPPLSTPGPMAPSIRVIGPPGATSLHIARGGEMPPLVILLDENGEAEIPPDAKLLEFLERRMGCRRKI